MLPAAEAAEQTLEALRARRIVLEAGGQRRDERRERRRYLALIKAELLAELLNGAAALRTADEVEKVHGASV